jgi:hypothetical protein
MSSKGKRVAFAAALLGIAVVLVGGFAFKNYLHEIWYVLTVKRLEDRAVIHEIERKLAETQSADIPPHAPVPEVLKVLGSISGINFILSGEAQEAVGDASITLPGTEAPLGELLDRVLRLVKSAKLKYEMEDGAVVVKLTDQKEPWTYPKIYPIVEIELPLDQLMEQVACQMKDRKGRWIGREPRVRGGALWVRTTMRNHIKIGRFLGRLRRK